MSPQDPVDEKSGGESASKCDKIACAAPLRKDSTLKTGPRATKSASARSIGLTRIAETNGGADCADYDSALISPLKRRVRADFTSD
jgi:hypothetical protein